LKRRQFRNIRDIGIFAAKFHDKSRMYQDMDIKYKNVLTADIGGTNSRFGYFKVGSDMSISLVDTKWLVTGEYSSFTSLLDAVKRNLPDIDLEKIDCAVFAVAGPVKENRYCSPPFIVWDIDKEDMEKSLGDVDCVIINDFEAQAFACRSPVIKKAKQVVSGTIIEQYPLAAVGAGTALGLCGLMPAFKGSYRALPSEGGHGSFPFELSEELDYMRFLQQRVDVPYIMCNTVVSGTGLRHLHNFLTGIDMPPEEISKAIDSNCDTVKWFSRFYGRICRNYALQIFAGGGVYIAGGVAARNPELVIKGEFYEEFLKSNTMKDFLKEIPIFLNSDENSGLWGAAFYAGNNMF
jgi:glucokinase